MAIRHIRDAFDQEADGVATSMSAILEYVEGTKQRLTIKASIAATNEMRVLVSDVHGMENEPNEEGRKLARALKDELANASSVDTAVASGAAPVAATLPPSRLGVESVVTPPALPSVAATASESAPVGANPFM